VGSPSSGLGKNGDYYLDVSVTRLYGPKTSGVWGAGVSLIGPQGANGTNGSNGSAATVSVGTVTTLSPGASATVTNGGTSSAAVLNFGIPAGNTGTSGTNGTNGTNGTAATIAVGTVTTGSAGSSASVTNAGTSSAATFNFTIPRGDVGATGPTGATGSTGPAGPASIGSPNTRTLSLATAYQATDNTKPAFVTINLSSSATLSLSGGTTNTATVVVGSTTGVATGTGTVICNYANTNTGALTIGLNLSTVMGSTCSFGLKAGDYFAIRNTAGTVTITSAFDQPVG
jgi:hypothetical protein